MFYYAVAELHELKEKETFIKNLKWKNGAQ